MTTPKEKAEELVSKFTPFADTYHYGNLANAKQCALIAVDELKQSTKNGLGITKYSKEYWQEVKKEIEKL